MLSRLPSGHGLGPSLDVLTELRARLEQTLPPETVERERSLLNEISALQAELRAGTAAGTVEARLEAAEASLEALYLDVRSSHPRFAQARSIEVSSLEAIQSTLAPGETLVQYFLGEEQSHVFLVDSQQLVHRLLGPREQIDEQVARAYTQLIDPQSGLDAVLALASTVLDPVTDLLDPGECPDRCAVGGTVLLSGRGLAGERRGAARRSLERQLRTLGVDAGGAPAPAGATCTAVAAGDRRSIVRGWSCRSVACSRPSRSGRARSVAAHGS